MTHNAAPSELPDAVFLAALEDDLNTPQAISELHRISKELTPDQMLSSARLLGLLAQENDPIFWPDLPGYAAEYEATIRELLDLRKLAREKRDFESSDRLRKGFADAGLIVQDTPQGAVWSESPNFDPKKLEALK